MIMGSYPHIMRRIIVVFTCRCVRFRRVSNAACRRVARLSHLDRRPGQLLGTNSQHSLFDDEVRRVRGEPAPKEDT